MAISSSTFIQDTVLFVRNYLRNNITDPITRPANERFIMTSYPKRPVRYPIITIKATGSNTEKLGMASEMHLVYITLEIRVWARNAKEADELASEVVDVLRDAEYNLSGTTDEGLYGFTLVSMVPVVEEVGEENLIHSKVMEFEYRAILS